MCIWQVWSSQDSSARIKLKGLTPLERSGACLNKETDPLGGWSAAYRHFSKICKRCASIKKDALWIHFRH